MDRCVRPLTGQLRDLARAALDQQGIAVRRLRWMGQHTNQLYRCDTATGERMVVRVCLPDGRSDGELTWLAALARDTGLTVPVARFSTRVATPQLPGGRWTFSASSVLTQSVLSASATLVTLGSSAPSHTID
jgi:Ser/Thr protein kinase RdoA (MazF antagonist)